MTPCRHKRRGYGEGAAQVFLRGRGWGEWAAQCMLMPELTRAGQLNATPGTPCNLPLYPPFDMAFLCLTVLFGLCS